MTKEEYVIKLKKEIAELEERLPKLSPWPKTFFDGTTGSSPQEHVERSILYRKEELDQYEEKPAL